LSRWLLSDAATFGSAASISTLAVKTAARIVHGSVSGAPKTFSSSSPAVLGDCSRTVHKTSFGSEILNRCAKFSISMRLPTRLQFPRSDTENVCHAATRFSVHCFNSYEVRAVTFAQRRENDSL
jgi:hypothetical protein